jgi:hypothetical protein
VEVFLDILSANARSPLPCEWVNIMLVDGVTSSSMAHHTGLDILFQELHELLGVDLQGPFEPNRALVDGVLHGSNDVIVNAATPPAVGFLSEWKSSGRSPTAIKGTVS